jgi:ketosteroid isomerase-like protein
MSLTPEIKIIQNWYAALAKRDIDKLVSLVHENVEIRDSQQTNVGIQALREKYEKGYSNLIPENFFYKDNLIVVEEKQEWLIPERKGLEFKQLSGAVFVVNDGLISRIMSHISLDRALQATDLRTIHRQGGTEENVIEIRFVNSWNTIEQFFNLLNANPNWKHMALMLDLMSKLRKQGYDRKFRAGQSVDSFILSRSHDYGLRPEQPSLNFVVNDDQSADIWYWDGKDKINLHLNHTEITPEVEALLERLAAQPID